MEPSEQTFESLVDELARQEDDEEDLFEIDLEIFSKIPPPHYWESYFTATNNTLLANCLLPIADVSKAVPMVVTAVDAVINVQYEEIKV
ncbi:hypothetical protein CDL12_22051 [Handroanthus impetiginosus]|uniref:Uncharacterized protein n=1 Tax=Handroanthus impetiginosus TaxID=429701 RepID=A0A2G9GJF5_9LAMI|nr:hypothetical protein CDL12_22051 [Handroanthus impetiginosus]